MGLFRVIKLNAKIVSVLNSCDRKRFEALIDEVLNIPRIFTSKLYVWNWIRGRDFYKMLAHYVIVNIENCHSPGDITYEEQPSNPYTMDHAERVLQMVLTTASDESVKKNFIWAITKRIPLLTADTISYLSQEKIYSLLRSDKVLITDGAINPFVTEIYNLRKQIKDLEDQLEVSDLLGQ